MSTAMVLREPAVPEVTPDQVELIKRTVAKDATADELKLYFYDCQRQGVHPLDKLIHFTKRAGKYTPVTSIDFMRTRAADSGEYAGNDDAQFSVIGESKYPDLATVTVYRFVQGQRCAFTATARWNEYLPEQAFMWKKMPYTMLGKCAEALALRKAFPRQLAGLYAAEEMDQAKRAKDMESQTWEAPEEKQAIVDRKLKELKPKDEPATEADEIERWKKLISVCVTAGDFNAMIPQVKNKPNVVKMALMTASLDRGLTFDKSVKRFCGPTDTLAPPQPQTPATEPAKDIESGLEDVPDSPKRVEGLYYQEVTVKDAERRNLKAPKKGQYILLTCRVQGSDQDLPVSVWDTKLHEYALGSKDKVCEFGLKRKESGERTYYSLETIEHIGGRKFVANAPVDGPTGKQLFG